jgi:murein tripeptide amidase MpaA
MEPTEVGLDFDHYYDYEELDSALHELAAAYPNLAKLTSIGKSHRGRDLWLIEITNQETGPGKEKPGYYIDGNTHPEEISGSMVALYTAWHLLSQYGEDEAVTRLVDRRTFYILPRVNPDGAEICLTMPFYEWIGNGLYLPGEEQLDADGLHYEDINGDGCIVDMRWPDPTGEWKISDKDPRLMIQREPGEYGGEYYRVIPEGMIKNFGGAEIPIPKPMDGNMNRNYPYDWGPEGEQYGAGEYPLSEPEIEAIVTFIQDHPNITGALNYHTHAGAILAPFNVKGEDLPLEDEMLYKRFGEIGEEETGYHFILKEEEFGFPGHGRRLGTASGFLYSQLGMICFVTELWDVFKESGIEKDWFFPLRALPEEHSLRLLKWNDEQLKGEGFVEWTPFDHPQLGEVEIGGWRRLFMFRNPPTHRLEEMCRKNVGFTLKHAAAAPEIHIGEVEVEPLGEGVYRVGMVVENWGYLSTNLTEQAKKMEAAKPVVARIELGEGLELVGDEPEVELGDLAGRWDRRRKYSRFKEWGSPAKKAQWVVRRTGEAVSAEATLIARSDTGGTDRRKVRLDEELQ